MKEHCRCLQGEGVIKSGVILIIKHIVQNVMIKQDIRKKSKYKLMSI